MPRFRARLFARSAKPDYSALPVQPRWAAWGWDKAQNITFHPLTLYSYCSTYVPVHPGRGLGRDGDHRWGGCGACGWDATFITHSGAGSRTRGYYGPRAFSGKTTSAVNIRHRAIWGSVRACFPAKTATKAWAPASAKPPDHTTGTLASVCAHATLRFSLHPPETA